MNLRRKDLWQVPLALLLIPLWLPLLLVGLAIVGGAEIWGQIVGHETDPSLICGCTRCLAKRNSERR